jgi:hypothetical protein
MNSDEGRWEKPQAMAIPKVGYFERVEGNYGPGLSNSRSEDVAGGQPRGGIARPSSCLPQTRADSLRIRWVLG